MKLSRSLRGLLLASAWMTGACTQILIGDGHFIPRDDGGEGGEGGGSGAGGIEPTVCLNGLTACNGTCVALDSDSSHCGSCGHDCLGAACSSGFCAVEVVASELGDPRGIAADDAHVYWTTGAGMVRRALKSGGAIETLAKEQALPGAIAVDAQFVYWINEGQGRVLRKAKDGNGQPKKLAESAELVGLALGGDGVYLSRKLKKGDIERIDKEGGGKLILATDQSHPSRIAVAGDRVVWTGTLADDAGDPDAGDGQSTGYVRSASASNGAGLVSVAEGEGMIVGLAIGGDTPIWADGTALTIRVRPPGSSAPITLVEQQDVRGLAADESCVFWTTAGGTVRRSPIAGGTPQALAIDLSGAGPAVVDATHVYFTREGPSGAILRVAK